MSDDTRDGMINLDDPSEYEDHFLASHGLLPRSQAVKELCLTMLRKLNAKYKNTPRRRTSGPLKGAQLGVCAASG